MAIEVEEKEEAELPELLELIDQLETSADLPGLLLKIGRRLRATPEDRDLLSDFEGITQIGEALASLEWQGEAMMAFLKIMPEVCRTSVVNRGSLRDVGFLAATVRLLAQSLVVENSEQMALSCTALAAMCTGNDANKEAAMAVEGVAEGVPCGALWILVELLRRHKGSGLQAEGLAALRALVLEDDGRKVDAVPCAVQNRELLLSEEVYPQVTLILAEAVHLEASSKLTEQILLLLREVARGEGIKELAKQHLSYVRRCLVCPEPRLVRASLAVLRAFAFCEDVRDELSLSCETKVYIQAVREHLGTPVVCEQGFGLLANLTLRNPAMASFLNDSEHQVVALGQVVLEKHRERPDVAKSVIQLLWSVSRQNPKALAEVREAELFPALRKLVSLEDPRFQAAAEVARQFLREFREDEGVQRKPVYNEFY